MNLSPLPIQKFFGNNGRPLSGGKLFTYVAGTNTKVATYTDSAGLTQNTNPIILNFRGECRLWIDPQQAYKFILAPSNDTDPPTNPIWTVDNITAAPQAFDNSSVDSGTANNISLTIPQISSPVAFTRVVFKAAATNTGATTLQINGGTALPVVWPDGTALIYGDIQADGIYQAIFDGGSWQLQGPRIYSSGDVRRYGVIGDGVVDDTSAMQAALTVGGSLSAPGGLTIFISSALTCSVARTSLDLGGSILKLSTTWADTANLRPITFSAADCTVRNGIFSATGLSTRTDSNTFIRFTSGAHRGNVNNCRFAALPSGASDLQCAVSFLSGADDCQAYACTFDDCPGAVFTQGARTQIYGHTVTAPKDVSFALNSTACFGSSVTGCKIFSGNVTVSGHIAIEEGASDFLILGNYIHGVKNGFGIGEVRVSVTTVVNGGVIADNIIDGDGLTTTSPSSLLAVSIYSRGCRIVNNMLRGMPAGLSSNAAMAIPALYTYLSGNRIDCTTGSSSAGAIVITPAGGPIDIIDNWSDCTGGPSRHYVFGSGSNSGFRAFFKGGTFIGGTDAINTDLNAPTNLPIWLENLTQSSATNVINLSGTDSIETFFNSQNAITQPHSIKVRRTVYGNAIPTQGAWVQGDKVWMIGPTASNTPGWICVADGTPGTWKAMANLAA